MVQKPTVLIADNHSLDLDMLTGKLATDANIVYASGPGQLIAVAGELKSLDMVLIACTRIDDEILAVCRQLKVTMPGLLSVVYASQVTAADWQRCLHAGVAEVLDASEPVESASLRISLLLELKYKTGLLTELALLDGLTSVPNRERFEQYLDIEWRRGLREFNTLTLLLIDIDHFTSYNERNGLNAGDNCLRRLARLLQNNCLRAADMVGRSGGDEFAALLPGTEFENALQVAEKMVKAFRTLAIDHPGSEQGILTLSIGVASIEPGRDSQPDDLLDEAAEMLAQARHGGGDQAQGIAI